MELKEEVCTFDEDQKVQVKAASDEFWATTECTEGPIFNKKLFFSIYMALLISIPNYTIFEILEYIDENSENEGENSEKSIENNNNNEEKEINKLENLYQDLINLKKVNFFAKNIKKRIEAKYDYYEKAFAKRVLIQNYQYNYHDLGEKTANFIQGRETIKKEMEQIKKYGVGEIKCEGCQIKWLKEAYGECLKCESENSINFFACVSNYFKVVCDMDKFFENIKIIDPKVDTLIADKGQEIQAFFKRQEHNASLFLNNKILRKYGVNQYRKLVKTKGADVVDQDEELRDFNRDYDLALTREDEELDLREAKNATTKEFVEDLSKLHFEFVRKIKFPPRKIEINDFKPDMPNLIEIQARDAKIKQIELDNKYFQKLERLDLQGNNIETIYDIINLKKVVSLRLVEISNNPIEKSRDLYSLINEFKKFHIEVRYSPQLMFHYKREIDEESDEEIKEIMIQHKSLHNTESLPSESNESNK